MEKARRNSLILSHSGSKDSPEEHFFFWCLPSRSVVYEVFILYQNNLKKKFRDRKWTEHSNRYNFLIKKLRHTRWMF